MKNKDGKTIIVSACLLGIPTRYDGGDSRNDELISELAGVVVIAICPEELGGLPTPRSAAEIKDNAEGRCAPDGPKAPEGAGVLDGTACVVTKDGTDVTSNFIKGAEEVLRIARDNQVTRAYLKEKSPSCGLDLIKKDGNNHEGSGVTTALLKKNNIETIGIS